MWGEVQGMALVKVTATGGGGHSLSPPSPKVAPASVIARIIQAVDGRPLPPRLVQPTILMLQSLGSAASSPLLAFVLKRAHVWCAHCLRPCVPSASVACPPMLLPFPVLLSNSSRVNLLSMSILLKPKRNNQTRSPFLLSPCAS